MAIFSSAIEFATDSRLLRMPKLDPQHVDWAT